MAAAQATSGVAASTSGVAADASSTSQLCDQVDSGSWIAGPAGGGLSALDATMRPTDALTAANLDWLTPYVRPMQELLDRMAGNASAVGSCADSWQQVSDTVGQLASQLDQSVRSQTASWQGAASDDYRDRSAVIGTALGATAQLCGALGTAARQLGQAAAAARTRVNGLVTELVGQLITQIGPAAASQGGATRTCCPRPPT